MKAFRIGRKPTGPWPNRTPPIRGGVFHANKTPADDEHTISEVASTIAVDSVTVVGDAADAAAPASPPTATTLPSIICTDIDDSAWSSSLAPPSPSDTTASSTFSRRLRTNSESYSSSEVATETSSLDGEDADATKPLTKAEALTHPDKWTAWAMLQEEEKDAREYPSVDAAVQLAITEKYKKLHETVREQGLYQCRYIEYGKEMARYLTLFGLFLYTLHIGWYIPSALFLGCFWQQIMFTAHDAGHTSITSIFEVDTLIAIFIADFCCGLSMGWWKSSHNVHHLVTNHPEHDPDIQNVPLFATCPSFFKSITSSYYDGFVFVWDAAADFLVPYQKYTYYPIMAVARFNLYFLSWCHVLSKRSSALAATKAWWIRPTEIAFMACYWFLFGYLLVWRSIPTWTNRVLFVLVSHLATMPLHVQITLSHWGMSTANMGETESFPQRQLRTTMDVDCPEWLDFIHGGLQFQAIHHLFPRVPRHNLRRVQKLVKEFCAETGIPYSTLSFVEGNKKVIGRLNDIGEQVKVLISCQKYMAATGESGLH